MDIKIFQGVLIAIIVIGSSYLVYSFLTPTPGAKEITETNNETDVSRCIISENIPVNKFRADYFDISEPNNIICSEIVDSVRIQYSWEDGGIFQIDSQKFGGRWVGIFEYETTKTQSIHISQGSSEAKILIDGVEVYNGDSSKSFDYTFTAGEHEIEVQYVNNWHTVDFSVSIQEPIIIRKTADVKNILSTHISQNDTNIWYVGLYESDSFDGSVMVDVASSDIPTVIFLNSYSPISWVLLDNEQANIKAIIISSYNPGSEVKNLPNDTDLIMLEYRALENISNLLPECEVNIDFDEYYCDDIDDNINEFAKEYQLFKEQISDLTSGLTLTGFTGFYSQSEINVPDLVIDQTTLNKIDLNIQTHIEAQMEYLGNQSLENVFE